MISDLKKGVSIRGFEGFDDSKMAARFARELKDYLAPRLDGRAVRVINSPRIDFDRDTEVVICHGKKLMRDLRLHRGDVHDAMVKNQILNESCVIVFAKNLAEPMDHAKVDLDLYAPRLARWLSSYGFSDTSSCTVCLEEGFVNSSLVICPGCQAPVCGECFARCVRSKVVGSENLPNVFSCPTCNMTENSFNMIGKGLRFHLTGTRFDNHWEMLDRLVEESSLEKPEMFVCHMTQPYNYAAALTVENGQVEIGTNHLSRVLSMMTTEGSLVCVGELPYKCACGAETCDDAGKAFGVTNGRACILRDGEFFEIRDGFPLVLACYYNL